jgi:hypothetical protein
VPNELGIVIRVGTIYDAKSKSFRRAGRVVTRHQVRAEIDKLTEHISRQAAKIGERYAKATLTLARFEIEMRELLKSGHIIASSVGRGGRSRMTQADWARVGSRLRREYGYLSKFVRKLGQGKIDKAFTANRAKKYSSSIVMSYHETMKTEETKDSVSEIKVRLVQNSREGCAECAADADRGWVNVEDMGEIGTRICGNFCLCDLEFSDDV